jgi:hypothetical protein
MGAGERGFEKIFSLQRNRYATGCDRAVTAM